MNFGYFAILSAVLLQASVSIFETDMSPGEGHPVFAASSNELPLRQLPSASSPIVGIAKVLPGQRLPYDETQYRTTRAGRISVLMPYYINGRMIGPVARLSAKDYSLNKFAQVRIEVRPGTNIEYLQYRAEGTCFVRIGSNVIDAEPCPTIEKSVFTVESEASTELWLHVAIGNSSGWLLVDGRSAKEVGRTSQ